MNFCFPNVQRPMWKSLRPPESTQFARHIIRHQNHGHRVRLRIARGRHRRPFLSQAGWHQFRTQPRPPVWPGNYSSSSRPRPPHLVSRRAEPLEVACRAFSPVAATTGSTTFRESMLFTHRGLSGPAILQISSFWQPGQPLTFDLLPITRATPGSAMRVNPARPYDRFFPDSGRSDSRGVDKSIRSRQASAALPQSGYSGGDTAPAHVEPELTGTEGYPKAEVTLGGVNTSELSSKTMESRKIRACVFIGEVVDVTGWLGGYNFQWAWASGNAAGQVV